MDEALLLQKMEQLRGKYPEMDAATAAKIALGMAPPPAMEQGGDFVGRILSNAVGIPKGMANLVTDPMGSVKASGQNFMHHMGDAGEMWNKGDRVRAGVHAVSAVPELLGFPTATAHDEMVGGNWGAGLGDAVSALGLRSAPQIGGAIGRHIPGGESVMNMGKGAGRMGVNAGQALVDRFVTMMEMKKAGNAPSPMGNAQGWSQAVTQARGKQPMVPDGFNPETTPPTTGNWIDANTVAGEYPTGRGGPRYSFTEDGFNPEATPPPPSPWQLAQLLSKKR